MGLFQALKSQHGLKLNLRHPTEWDESEKGFIFKICKAYYSKRSTLINLINPLKGERK